MTYYYEANIVGSTKKNKTGLRPVRTGFGAGLYKDSGLGMAKQKQIGLDGLQTAETCAPNFSKYFNLVLLFV